MPTDASGPNIELLRTFLLFAQHREVGRTAKAIGVNISGVSRRLQELTGPPYDLLRKRGNAVQLTEKGEAMLPSVTRLLRDYDQLIGRLTDRETLSEVLRIAVGGGLATTPFPRALAAFRALRPTVGVRVLVCRGRERVRGVARGEFDLALVSHDEAQVRVTGGDGVELRVETLREQPLVIVAAANSADGKKLAACSAKVPIPLSLLPNLTLLGMDGQSGVRRQLDRELSAAGLKGLPQAAVLPGGWTSALACVRQGLGTALLPADLPDPGAADVVVRPFLPGFRLVDRVVWPSEFGEDRVTDFVACLKTAFAG